MFMLLTVPDTNMNDRRKHIKGTVEFRYIKCKLTSFILKFQLFDMIAIKL